MTDLVPSHRKGSSLKASSKTDVLLISAPEWSGCLPGSRFLSGDRKKASAESGLKTSGDPDKLPNRPSWPAGRETNRADEESLEKKDKPQWCFEQI